jgi:hypothetical protein
MLGFCFFCKGFPFAETTALFSTPLAGEAVRTGMLLFAGDTFRHVDQAKVIGHLLKIHLFSVFPLSVAVKSLYHFSFTGSAEAKKIFASSASIRTSQWRDISLYISYLNSWGKCIVQARRSCTL